MKSQLPHPVSDSPIFLFRSAGPATALAALVLLAAAALPLRAQVTVEVVAKADDMEPTPLWDLDQAATRGGHYAHNGVTQAGVSVLHDEIWRDGAVAVRARDASHPAPGTSSTFSAFNDEVFVNTSGQIAFTANTVDNSNRGFWAGAPGALQFVARHGSPAPGTNGNFLIGSPGLGFGELQSYNDAGQVAFIAQVEGAPNNARIGLWAGFPGALQLVAREGSQAPGFPTGVAWNYLEGIQLNSAGQTAVYGRVTQKPPAETQLSDGYVLMAGPPGNLVPTVKAGDPAPGCEPFTFLRLSDKDYTLNATGQMAYVTDIWSGKFGIMPSSRGIYRWSAAGGSELVLRSGYPGPGLNADTVFLGFRPPQFNAAGEIAVEASTGPVSEGIWTGLPGRLRKVAQTDDIAPGTGGQLFGNFQDDVLLLSDSGQVAFIATYGPGGGFYPDSASTGLFATDKTGALHFLARIGAALSSGPVLTLIELNTGRSSWGSKGRSDSGRSSYDRDGRLLFYASGHYNNPATGNTHFQKFIYRATFPEVPPAIPPAGQPLSVRGAMGGSAVFDVSALGSRPATYQWRRNGTPLANGTSATLKLTNLTTNDRGAYTVVITNAQGSVTSAPAPLSFPPVITAQPQDISVNAGTAASLGVSATGPGALAWQWQYKAAGAAEFANISGATASALTLPGIARNQAGRYRVAVTNADGSTLSREAVVTVAETGAPLITRILIPGDPVTGISENVFFSNGENAVLNNHGEIAFEGKVGTDSSGATLGTYFRSAEGDYRFVLWQGFDVNLSDSGEMAQINGPTIEHGFPENMLPLARRGDEAPGGGGYYYLNGAFALADDGTTAFRFDLDGKTAVFIGKPGAVSVLGMRGRAAPGLPQGVVFDYVMDPVINPSGTAAFFATLSGPGLTEDNNTSLWKGTAAGVQRMVAAGDSVPAAGSGVVIGAIRFPDSSQPPFGWNEAGQVAFETTLTGAGVTGDNDRAILAGSPGALAVAAREGLASGYNFYFPRASYPLLNRAGQVAFVATVNPAGTGENLESLWLWTPGANGGTRQLIALEGQQAPGLPAGVVLDSADLALPHFSIALNGAGQIALSTRLSGPGISFDTGNDIALYLTTPSGELKLVARTGSPIDLGGGQTRELGSLNLALRSGGEDGRPRSFSEAGEVLFTGALRKPGSFALDYGLFTARLAGSAAPSPLPVYNAWAATAFPTGTPAALTAPDADADGDDLPNAIEYLTGTDPRTPSPSPETIRQLPDGSISLTFPRRTGVPEGLEIIETIPELGGIWTPVPRRSITHTANGPGQPITITVTLPAGADSAYVRLRVEF